MDSRFRGQANGLPRAAVRASVAVVLWSIATSAHAATAAKPTFSPAGGTYDAPQTVTIATTTAGAKIYYTTNGTTPTTKSTLYAGPVAVSASKTLKAIAAATGYTTSAAASATYTLVAGMPAFSPAAGTYTVGQRVTISTVTPGAQIYYTTDGTTPTTGSSAYSGPVAVNVSATVRAIAVAPGFSSSAVGSASYTITPSAATPTFAPAPGRYTETQRVTMTSATTGAQIHYTLDGSDPTTASASYAGPITVGATTTVKAIASASGFTASPVATASYVIEPPAPAPRLSPLPGAYPGPVNVTLSADVLDAEIHFTLDDTSPTLLSSTYTSPIAVGGDTTIRAVSVAPGYSVSREARGTYSAAPSSPDAIAAEFTRSWTTTAAGQTVQFSTAAPDVLLLAFVAAGGTAGASPTVTSSDVAWTPLGSAGAQPGFAGIWWATAPVALTLASTQVARATSGPPLTVTIVALVGARPVPGATEAASGASGVPTVSFAATAAGAWYYGVGSDGVAAIPRTLLASQTLVSETTDAVAPSDLWVQQSAAAPAQDGASLAIGASSPTSDPWNLAAIEVLPAVLPPPAFNPPGGTYDRPVTVALSARPGVRIRYTTDGTGPTTASTEYTGQMPVSRTTTISAIADDGYSTSAVVTATYTIVPVLASLSVQASSTTLATGGTMQCSATGTYTDGSSRNVTTEVSWSSSDAAVASVAASGLVTGAAAGSATITATSGALAASAAVSVQGPATTYCYDAGGNMTARLACATSAPCDARCP